MAAGAWIWNLELIRHFRRNERERVTADIDIRNRLLDLRHVAGHTVVAGTAGAMMGMRLDARGVRTVGRRGAVAGQANLGRRFDQVSVILSAVDIVATKAAHTAPIHHALDEVVALHSIFVTRSVGEMRERRLAKLVIFQFPKIF